VATTTERQYGWQHQQLRKALLAVYHPAQPCPRCGQPLGPDPSWIDLGHVEGSGKTAYEGLVHARCNRSGGAKYGNLLRGRDGSKTRQRQRRRRGRGWRWTPDGFKPASPPTTSRRW
jgi:hypothetical protein